MRSCRAYEPRQVLDPDDPVSIGAMVGPEAFEEVRYLSHLRQLDALERIPALASEFATAFGRESGGLLHTYRTDDAETIVVALGSVLGTIKDAVDRRRELGERVGVVGITSFRPFPLEAVRDALARGSDGSSSSRRPSASASAACSRPTSPWRPTMRTLSLRTVVAGLGGRAITQPLARSDARRSGGSISSSPVSFLDLDLEMVDA